MSTEDKPDFGVYHHSTPKESEKIREKTRILFIRTFNILPFPQDDKIKILDMGCGLGFLSSVCAEYYSKGKVIGVDTFEHASLKDSSLKKAKNNVRIMGLSERITFQKKDILHSDFGRGKFDLLVSNLVFHNFGKKRFESYKQLVQWSTPKSHIVLGDIFFDYKTDFHILSGLFNNIKRVPDSSIGSAYKMLVLSEPKK